MRTLVEGGGRTSGRATGSGSKVGWTYNGDDASDCASFSEITTTPFLPLSTTIHWLAHEALGAFLDGAITASTPASQ